MTGFKGCNSLVSAARRSPCSAVGEIFQRQATKRYAAKWRASLEKESEIKGDRKVLRRRAPAQDRGQNRIK
jgi:hypothetical protein